MSKWKKGLISLAWVMLGQLCIAGTGYMGWLLFNPTTPYESTGEIAMCTLLTIFMLIAYPLCSLVCFSIGLKTEEMK